MNNFIRRTITGAVFVITIIGSVLLSKWAFAALFLLVALGGMLEFIRIAAKIEMFPSKSASLIFSAIVYAGIVAAISGVIPVGYLLFGLAVVPLQLCAELFRKSSKPFGNVAASALGIIWIVVPLALLSGFFNDGAEQAWLHGGALLGFFLILWIYDSGAYIFGSMLGKRKMLERISPGKSWEGFAGGMAVGLLTAYMISASFKEFPVTVWLLIAVVIIVFGTLGDLIESMLKRSAGVKDSGTLLPGHGGILDRFDAVFVAAPMVFIIIWFIR